LLEGWFEGQVVLREEDVELKDSAFALAVTNAKAGCQGPNMRTDVATMATSTPQRGVQSGNEGQRARGSFE